jgi:hypothetical protein
VATVSQLTARIPRDVAPIDLTTPADAVSQFLKELRAWGPFRGAILAIEGLDLTCFLYFVLAGEWVPLGWVRQADITLVHV